MPARRAVARPGTRGAAAKRDIARTGISAFARRAGHAGLTPRPSLGGVGEVDAAGEVRVVGEEVVQQLAAEAVEDVHLRVAARPVDRHHARLAGRRTVRGPHTYRAHERLREGREDAQFLAARP